MADRFLTIDTSTGQKKLITPISTSTGTADANKIIMTDSQGKIDSTLLPTGVGAETLSIVASEALSAGDLVNIFDDVGTVKVRKADASSGFKADGFVLAAVTSGNYATVYTDGINNQLSGLTAGNIYYLSTGGTITDTVPSSDMYQVVGKAASATELIFERNEPITL